MYGIHEKHLEDEFLFCESLDTKTTVKDISCKLNRFFEEHHFQWKPAITFCTDGAPAMLGCPSSFQTLVKEIHKRYWNSLDYSLSSFNGQSNA